MPDLTRPSAVAAVSPALFRSLAAGALALNALVLIGALALQLFRPGAAAVALLVIQAAAVTAAALSLVLLGRRPLAVAALPLLVATAVAIALYAILFPPLSGSIIAALAVVVLIAALTGSRRLTAVAAAASLLGGLLVALIGPRLSIDLDVTMLLGPPALIGPLLIVGMVWFAADRLILARDQAIALAERRAAEAEQARATAELARATAEARAEEQARLLELVQSLELPVLAVGPGVLALPLIGNLDTRRLAAIRTAVLAAVARARAHTVVFDLTAVAEVDTAVARGLIDTARAVRLLGARSLVSGLRSSVAQTLAGLGVALDGLQPVADLQEAILSRDERA